MIRMPIRRRPPAKVHSPSLILFWVVCLIIISLLVPLLLDLILNSKAYGSVPRLLIILTVALVVFLIFHLFKMSSHDRLTGLPLQKNFGRFAFKKIMRKRLQNYSAIFINIKGYKYVNRMAGNANGDYILAKYANILRKFLKPDEMIARLGGDNFIILIKTIRLSGILSVLEKVDIPIELNGKPKIISISAYAGIVNLTKEDGVSDVFTKSSMALNYLKQHHLGNYIFYNQEIDNLLIKEKKIAYMFHEALEKERFKVYYQPKVDIKTKKLTGCEALVRWEEDGSFVSPSDFIPTLESTGLIIELDFYVMNKVCQDINSWRAKGYTCVPVSTNFSKIHLRDPEFAYKVLRILSINNTDKSLFEVELTESENFENYDSLINFLEIMNKNNIKTAIDDFGIGYSSLALLKNPNVQIVKIDKSFVDNIEYNKGNNNDFVLAKNIIQTCHELNKEIICEGIEKPEQLEILKDLDCTIIQGFFFDKPLTHKSFEERLLNPIY